MIKFFHDWDRIASSRYTSGPSLSDHENENETANFVFVFGKNDPTYLATQTKMEISVLVGFTYRVVQYTGVHTYCLFYVHIAVFIKVFDLLLSTVS